MPVTKPASQISDFIGVCIHPNWPVSRNMNWQKLILDLGIRHTRGMLGRQRGDLQYMKPLFDAGVKHCSTVVQSAGGTLDKAAAAANFKAVVDLWGANNVIALEGPNEFNHNNPANWVVNMRDFIKFMHQTIRANSGLNNVKIIAPSIWGRVLKDYQAVTAAGSLDQYFDRGCLHYYTDKKIPTQSNTTMDVALTNASILSPKIKWITECGYSNHVTDKVKAKYTLRLFYEFLLRDHLIEKAYNYELFDSKADPKWGLCGPDFKPRPAYYSLKNVMSLYKDSGTTAPAPLEVQVEAPSTAKLRYLIHGKSDGSYLVSLFRDIPSIDADAAPVSVRLSLTKSASAEHILPTFDATPKPLSSGTSFTVPVTDQVSIVRIRF